MTRLVVTLVRLAALLVGASLALLWIPVAFEPAGAMPGVAALFAAVGLAVAAIAAGSFAPRRARRSVRRRPGELAQPHHACGSCGRDFSSAAALTRHREAVHRQAALVAR